jgi:hypothetical protein
MWPANSHSFRRYIRGVLCGSLSAVGALCCLSFSPAAAQPTSGLSPIVVADLYAAYSTAADSNDERPYVTQASHTEEPRVNLLAFGSSFDDQHVRFAAVAQYGDSVDRNYSQEPEEGIRYVQEGYVGAYLSPSLSVDAGVFLSHIGAESWISTNNLTYTRSFTAEFSPYYDSGVRFNYRPSESFNAGLFIVNGWQNISDERHPAVGTKLSQRLGTFCIVSNSFLGAENGGTRVFHDLVLSRSFRGGNELSSSWDVGHQSADDLSGGWWWGANVMGRAPLAHQISLSARLELFQDPSQVIVNSVTNQPFRAYGASVGIDVSLGGGFLVRGEVKRVFAVHDIFEERSTDERNETMSVVSVAYAHDLALATLRETES